MSAGPDAFFIRSAMRSDLDAVRSLLVETWHDTYDALIGREKVTEITHSWHSVPALAARLERARSEFIVADNGGQIAGMAYAEASKDGRTVLLRQLYVLPSMQRQGIGSQLLNEIADCYPEARRVVVEVEEKNERAIAFYRAHGFWESERRADPLGHEVVVYQRAAAVWSGL
ncbi:GNAT family N-acetyltransferase [Chelativorans sp.]|uniref:GNAT family N-acetyltransferase n=1 Tax=Chelativorans sp. TaxID=2203393 RepID=UPI00281278AC|nr:GNAT family N-acetyltransferase [Chelativorans sp.]